MGTVSRSLRRHHTGNPSKVLYGLEDDIWFGVRKPQSQLLNDCLLDLPRRNALRSLFSIGLPSCHPLPSPLQRNKSVVLFSLLTTDIP